MTAAPVDALVTQEREWLAWTDQRTPNDRGPYRFRASFNLLGLDVTAEWTEEQMLCGMGYSESEWWPLKCCYWDGYRRYITNKTLEWSSVQACDPDGVLWTGLDLSLCPFTGKPPTIEVSGQYIGAPMWRSEAIWLSSPAVPKRRWTNAKAMQTAWNTRAPDTTAERRGYQLGHNAAIEKAAHLRDVAENLIISIGMGWDLDGCVDAVERALAQSKESGDE